MRLTLRETLLAFRRAPLLSAWGVMTIAFSLFSLGLFVLVAVNIRDALQQVEERVEIRAYLAEGTPVEALAAALGDIGAFPEVARADGISQDEALERARAERRGRTGSCERSGPPCIGARREQPFGRGSEKPSACGRAPLSRPRPALP